MGPYNTPHDAPTPHGVNGGEYTVGFWPCTGADSIQMFVICLVAEEGVAVMLTVGQLGIIPIIGPGVPG